MAAGIDFEFNYRKLCIASLYIQLNKAKFVCSNKDRYEGKGNRLPASAGCMVKAIETASGVLAETMGKPSKHLFDLVRSQHGLQDEPLDKFLMTGDFLETDIVFG